MSCSPLYLRRVPCFRSLQKIRFDKKWSIFFFDSKVEGKGRRYIFKHITHCPTAIMKNSNPGLSTIVDETRYHLPITAPSVGFLLIKVLLVLWVFNHYMYNWTPASPHMLVTVDCSTRTSYPVACSVILDPWATIRLFISPYAHFFLETPELVKAPGLNSLKPIS